MRTRSRTSHRCGLVNSPVRYPARRSTLSTMAQVEPWGRRGQGWGVWGWVLVMWLAYGRQRRLGCPGHTHRNRVWCNPIATSPMRSHGCSGPCAHNPVAGAQVYSQTPGLSPRPPHLALGACHVDHAQALDVLGHAQALRRIVHMPCEGPLGGACVSHGRRRSAQAAQQRVAARAAKQHPRCRSKHAPLDLTHSPRGIWACFRTHPAIPCHLPAF